MPARVVGTRLPCCPGRDSRYTIKHNSNQPGRPWWVYYEPPGADPIPADDAHRVLVELVNAMKDQISSTSGGPFSINEHGQVIARTRDPGGHGNTVHSINVVRGTVSTYSTPIIFENGELSPLVEPREGQLWSGPLSGMTYKFAAPGNPKPPTRNFDEIFTVEEGEFLLISKHANIRPYPPTDGLLGQFLKSMRKQLPRGGRFRVNEHGRAFTSNGSIFIGTIPRDLWFRPLTARS